MTTSTTRAKTNPDMLALRHFVTAQDHDASRQNPHIIKIDLTHSNLIQQHLEIRFDRDSSTISDVAYTIYRKTGTPPRDQYLQVYVNSNVVYETTAPDEDQTRLMSIGLQPFTVQNQRVHCIDMNPHSTSARGGLENVNLVKKFELTEEQYDRMTNTVRAHKRRQQQEQAKQKSTGGVTAESKETTKEGMIQKAREMYNESSIQHVKDCIGQRCQVEPGSRRGYVAWAGQMLPGHDRKTKPGYWVGVVFDEPVGNNDGTLITTTTKTSTYIDDDDDDDDHQEQTQQQYHRYFEAQPKHGCFVRGPNVTVGDFPERDIFDELDDDDDDDDEL